MTSTPRPDRLLSIAHACNPVPGPDGALHLASDMAGVTQVYRQAGPDRFPVRVAASQDRTLPVAHTPLGLLVRFDGGGNEVWQLGLVGEDGEMRQVTRDGKAIHRDVTLAPGGRRAGLAFNPGGRADWALGVIDLETGEIETRVDQGGYWRWLAWDGEGRMAVVVEQHGSLVGDAYLLDPAGELLPLLPDARRVTAAFWAGGRLFAIAELGSPFVGLAEIDPSDPTQVLRWLVREQSDVEAALPDPAGGTALVVLNAGPTDELRLLDLTTGAARPAGGLPPGLVYSDNATSIYDHIAWAETGDRLFVAWESATSPGEIYELTEGTRWTWASGERLAGLPEPVELRIPSFDGLEIPALHYRVDGTPRGTVVFFHGGPESQIRARFNPAIAMWNAAGLDVVAPNVRGSTGYGSDYASLDDRGRRWEAVRDGCEVGRWLRSQGLASRLVAMGGSYGGFMTLAVLVEDPSLWDAAVDIVGIGDWHTFLRNTSGWRRAMRMAEYGDPDSADAEFLATFSPLRQADRITASLLVIHGRNDPRVPVSEAEQIHRAVQGSELLVFDDEGHGITRHGNRARAYGRALEFVSARLGA